MNIIGFWACGVLVIPFGIVGILFAIFKEKATKFVAGFNSLSKEEQALYDKAYISRDILVTPYMAILAFIIWLFLFLKDVHWDNHKAFEKYLLKKS